MHRSGKLIFWAWFMFSGLLISSAQVQSPLKSAEKEYLLSVLNEFPKEGWEYSFKGGYLFRFKVNLLGDSTPEVFFGSSLKSGAWIVLDSEFKPLGEIKTSGLDYHRMRRLQTGTSVLDSYQNSDFEKYIIEYWITSNGVENKSRKVITEYDQNEYVLLSSSIADGEEIETLRMKVEFIRLEDILSGEDKQWMIFEDADWVYSDGYYLHHDDVEVVRKIKTSSDEKEIETLMGEFTKNEAIKKLSDKKMSMQHEENDFEAIKKGTPAISSNSNESLQNQLQPKEKESKQADEKSYLLWIITGIFLAGMLFFLFKKRKHK